MQPLRPARWKLALPFAVFLFLGFSARGAIVEDEIRQGYDLSPTANVSIRNTGGRIFVYGSKEPRLEILAVRRAFTKERLEAIKVSVVIAGESATVETVYPPAPQGSLLADRSGTVDYIILVPQTCTLSNVALGRGEILIEGLRGNAVAAQLGGGVMHVRDCFCAVTATLGEGKLDLSYSWWETRPFSLSATVDRGELRLGLPAAAAVQLDAATAHGRIRNYFSREPSPGENKTLETKFGEGALEEFRLRITDGNILLWRMD
ncbi:MAG TPA: hypothetical protein VK474_10220 [Chthoniobacterales bacterium]|nr:hypothetical protein [Chthoniobacterales bacterium]